MMKHIKLLAAMFILSFAVSANAADFDALIKANYAARGGKAIEKVKSISAVSEIETSMGNIAVKYFLELPKKFAIEVEQMGQIMKFFNNGDKTAFLAGEQYEEIPENLEGTLLMQFPYNLFFRDNALVKPGFCTAENTTLEKATLNEKEYQVIKVKINPFVEILYYIDPTTKLEVAYGINLLKTGNDEFDQQLEMYSNLKPVFEVKEWLEVDGVKFPKMVEITVMGNNNKIHITKVEINKPIEAKYFSK